PIFADLVECFLQRFTDSGVFFFEPLQFYTSALMRLPSEHPSRPSRALLSTVYLWGCVLSASRPPAPYTEEALLRDALQSLPGALRRVSQHPKCVLETIQIEVLLSLYYLHAALPVLGRYHASAAASLALSAGLHQIRGPSSSAVSPGFLLAAPVLPPTLDVREEAERIGAFWAVIIINNYWIAADGCPSAMPTGITIHTPWPLSSQAGATITKFLNGDEQEGRSPIALLAKASVLLERIIAFSARNSSGPPDPTAWHTLDTRLQTFQSSLPNAMGSQPLAMAHALTDLAILRLHAPLARASESARHKCFAAAHRAAAGLASVDLTQPADPILGVITSPLLYYHLHNLQIQPLYAALSAVYIAEMAALRGGAQYQDLDARVTRLVSVITALTAKSPVMRACSALHHILPSDSKREIRTECCLASTQQAYAMLVRSR
ncbi:hypothetical protein FB451DRAFT_1453471, partial [Mycena latifolia]